MTQIRKEQIEPLTISEVLYTDASGVIVSDALFTRDNTTQITLIGRSNGDWDASLNLGNIDVFGGPQDNSIGFQLKNTDNNLQLLFAAIDAFPLTTGDSIAAGLNSLDPTGATDGFISVVSILGAISTASIGANSTTKTASIGANANTLDEVVVELAIDDSSGVPLSLKLDSSTGTFEFTADDGTFVATSVIGPQEFSNSLTLDNADSDEVFYGAGDIEFFPASFIPGTGFSYKSTPNQIFTSVGIYDLSALDPNLIGTFAGASFAQGVGISTFFINGRIGVLMAYESDTTGSETSFIAEASEARISFIDNVDTPTIANGIAVDETGVKVYTLSGLSYYFPTNDGTLEQVQATNGSGQLAWVDVPLITTGTSAPGTTPTKVGNFYIDTALAEVYVSTGTTSSSDWTKVN